LLQALAPAATEYLAAKGFDPVFGGRPVKRVIQRELETPLARAILRGDFQVWQLVDYGSILVGNPFQQPLFMATATIQALMISGSNSRIPNMP
jgi:hypothetical protein